MLLHSNEPVPWCVERETGRSRYLFLCDHAGNRIPCQLASLGLSNSDLQRHIAWDIGALALGRALSSSLDATLIAQPYSRLVIDCNRPPEAADSIPLQSEATHIPGNQALAEADRDARREAIFGPYHARVEEVLRERETRGQPTWLIALHSFTPVYLQEQRPWHIGLLFNRDARLANAMAELLRSYPHIVVGINQPYDVSDQTDYAIPRYGEALGLPHLEIEVRQDLIDTMEGQNQWARTLTAILADLVLPD